MTQQNIAVLNDRFGLTSTLEIIDRNSVPVLRISTPDARATIALQGAQVLEWQPAGHQPVLWVSRAAVYQSGKGVRGGVPVCWPWFGAGETGKPAHGFVRTRMWELRAADWHGDLLVVRMGIKDDAETRAIWDHAFDLEMVVTMGETLVMELVTRNTGDRPFTITQALHTYFRVGDIENTRVMGLENVEYLDKVQNFARATQHGAVVFGGETDRVYVNTTSTCVIDDNARDRSIHIAKAGSHSTVVWNPWIDKAAGFSDMQPEEYREMVCVETCNAADDTVTVAPGESYTLRAEISARAD